MGTQSCKKQKTQVFFTVASFFIFLCKRVNSIPWCCENNTIILCLLVLAMNAFIKLLQRRFYSFIGSWAGCCIVVLGVYAVIITAIRSFAPSPAPGSGLPQQGYRWDLAYNVWQWMQRYANHFSLSSFCSSSPRLLLFQGCAVQAVTSHSIQKQTSATT